MTYLTQPRYHKTYTQRKTLHRASGSGVVLVDAKKQISFTSRRTVALHKKQSQFFGYSAMISGTTISLCIPSTTLYQLERLSALFFDCSQIIVFLFFLHGAENDREHADVLDQSRKRLKRSLTQRHNQYRNVGVPSNQKKHMCLSYHQ